MLSAMTRGTALFPAYSTAAISRGIREAFGEVAALLFGSATFSPRPAVDNDVHELVEPHLAILVHKRTRYVPERWAGELDGFVRRTFFWPEPAATEAFGRMDRGQLARLVDRIVAEAQERQAQAQAAALPATSRFDSSWAD
jgi:hypothetical protein